MTAKEYLSRYCSAKKEIECKREEIRQLEAMAEYSSPGMRRGSGGSASDKVGRLAAKIADEKRLLEEQVAELMALREEIKAVIDRVENTTFRQLLTLRYINGYTFERVAEEMFYTYKWVYVLHGRALGEVDGVIYKSE